MMWVYKVTNRITGKAYIGATCDLKNRWYNHKLNARKDRHCKKKPSLLAKAIKRHGLNAFEFKVLRKVETALEAHRLEIKSIEKHKTLVPDGYNILLISGLPGRRPRRKLPEAWYVQKARAKALVAQNKADLVS